VLLHARERHVELLGEVRDRSVCTSELLQNAASGGIRERGERVIEAGLRILNHMVQYMNTGRSMQGEADDVTRSRVSGQVDGPSPARQRRLTCA
jgi:hypothetical protein